MDTNNTLNNSYALTPFDQIKKFKSFSSNISISDISKWFSKNFTSLTNSISLGCKNVSAKAMPILNNVIKEANKELVNFIRFFQENPIAATIMGVVAVGTVALLINNHIKSKNIQKLNNTITEKDKKIAEKNAELDKKEEQHAQDLRDLGNEAITEIENIDDKHKTEIQNIQNKHKTEIKDIQKNAEEAIDQSIQNYIKASLEYAKERLNKDKDHEGEH